MKFRSAIAFILVLVSCAAAARAGEIKLPKSLPGDWQTFGRANVTTTGDSATIGNGFLADLTPRGACEIRFQARAPRDDPQVQIWGAIRVLNRDSRYVFALRGGSEPEISLARYAPDGNSKFLGWAPLDFMPAPGQWYRVRVAAAGSRFQVYVNDDALPRINVEDSDALWSDGGIALGGGWLPTEFSDLKVTPLTGSALAAFNALGDRTWEPPAVDHQALRVRQRAAYQPATLDRIPSGRAEVSLDGDWLFMPDQDLGSAPPPTGPDVPDQNWNVIPVPSFWTPTLGWLHGEQGMPGLKGLSAYHGPSDKLIAEEYQRVNSQTFDWRNTHAGWYRQTLELPANLAGKHFELVFDAIAKVSQVWVNGIPVGANVGMFRQLTCDITRAVKPGRNVIAVHVIANPEKRTANGSKVVATAVTADVTDEMLHSLPHGMTDDNCGGIWQPVSLLVTSLARVGDVFIKPRLDGASAHVEVLNGENSNRTLSLSYAIRDNRDQSILDSSRPPIAVTVPANGKVIAVIRTPTLHPKLWSPQFPNLYVLDLKLSEGARVVDEQQTRFGFRTFVVDRNRFLLNGKPFWLRGADHFPATLRPNDPALAHRFMELARDGNVWVTRTHAIPFTRTWLDAADEVGMGVSFEGTWPWLMIKGEPPKPELIQAWKDGFASLIREYRNHPSILFWTVNNEMNFAQFDANNPALLKRKWKILDDMIRTMRQIDPTRPISAYSNYARANAMKSYREVVAPNHFDDGDIDDTHQYYGWYGESFFHLFDGQFGKRYSTPGRPLISQEMSTGYPRNDGWPSRTYEFQRYVPEALVGNYAFEQNDPSLFMTRQAFMTKELAEALRRTDREDAAGILHFAYLTWFTDVWKAGQVRPKLTYYALKEALQPVLVSAELFGRHFHCGEDARRRVCLLNDSDEQRPAPAGTLTWEIRTDGAVLARGEQAAPAVPYYANRWMNVDFKMPASLPAPRVDAELVLTLDAGGKRLSQNTYAIVVASHAWADPRLPGQPLYFDPTGKAQSTTAGLAVTTITSLHNLDPSRLLIVGDAHAVSDSPSAAGALESFVEAGGRALLLQPGADLVKLFPQQIKSYRATHGEIVNLHVPESPVFDGIEPLDLAWFEMGGRNIPYACSGTYEVDRTRSEVTTLADECEFHGDVKGDFFRIAGAPLVEIHAGRGVVLASEMMLSARNQDPVAGRLLRNMLAYLTPRPAPRTPRP